MTKAPLVSIIIPCYNKARYLAQAIDSALATGLEAVEVICVDDGSTDDSAAIAGRYLGDSRFRLERKANGGLSSARNAGLALARAPYVKFLDADDLLLPGALPHELAFLETHPECGVTIGNYHRTNEAGVVYQTTNHAEGPFDGRHLLVRNQWAIHAALYRREWVDRVFPFDEGLRGAEDWDFNARLYLAGCRFHRLALVTAAYRQVPGSLSRASRQQTLDTETVARRLFAHPALPESDRPLLKEALSETWQMGVQRSYLGGDGEFGAQLVQQLVDLDPPRWMGNHGRALFDLLVSMDHLTDDMNPVLEQVRRHPPTLPPAPFAPVDRLAFALAKARFFRALAGKRPSEVIDSALAMLARPGALIRYLVSGRL
jgi:hypothetical protein